MGPRQIRRGVFGPVVIQLDPVLLQWGRGKFAAECSASRWFSRRRVRRFNGAAANSPRSGREAGKPGFNGAAANSPRSGKILVRCLAREVRLQWGRGKFAAECRLPLRRLTSAKRCFNGAAANSPRSDPQPRDPCYTISASMGPRQIRRGVLGLPGLFLQSTKGFNGAAANSPRSGEERKRSRP